MTDKVPKRPVQHDLETASERFFEYILPRNWPTEKIKHDYGTDLVVHVFEDGGATRYQFIVQLKSSNESTQGDEEIVPIRIATYNYLMAKIDVSILIKYVDEVEEAYYIFIRDIPIPPDNVETFTIRIPKTNRLSNINWQEQILGRVRPILDGKHEAGKNL